MNNDEKHFTSIYRYILTVTIIVLVYVIAITFIPIPEKNQRFVDIALAFLLGWISANSQYLTGGNPVAKKSDVNVTGDQPTVNTTPIQQEKQE